MFDELDVFNLNVVHPLFDTALILPKIIRSSIPGTLSSYQGYFGTGSIALLGTASLAVGPSLAPFSINSIGINLHTGLSTVLGSFVVTGTSTHVGATFSTLTATSEIKSANTYLLGKSNTIVGKDVTIVGKDVLIASPNLTINGDSWLGYIKPKLEVAGKGFDITHPTKPNHRLRYICLEGPEIGTYLRGKLKGENVIELPDYWTEDFIYPESITVNLTPVGKYQQLYVKSIEGRIITIESTDDLLGEEIECHYTIFAERKTKDRLQPEYEGQTPLDYPGNNSEYSLAGWDYDQRLSI